MTASMSRSGRSQFLSITLVAALFSLASQALWADFAVQVGYYQKSYYAEETASGLRSAGYSVEMQPMLNQAGKARIRLIVGPYPDRQTADDALRQLKEEGRDGFIINYSVPLPEKPKMAPSDAITEPPPVITVAPMTPPPPDDIIPMEVQTDDVPASSPQLGVLAPEPATEDNFVGLDDLEDGRSVLTTGFFQSEVAEVWPKPEHLSKFRNTLEVSGQGRVSNAMAWKISGRLAYDAVFDLNDYYSTAVRDDQQFETSVRETYLDITRGDWDFRLGRQQIVWSEMVGLFFADVVSAKDLREFVLPELEILRIPQWAVRGEYFKGDFHGEAIWIPYPTYNDIGVPGSEFYAYPTPPPPGYGMIISGEHQPAGSLSDSNYGIRFSYLYNGWDMSAFYYDSMDTAPTFFREIISTPTPAFVYKPDHTRIEQLGGTLSKDLAAMVLKAEMIYTHDRWFALDQLSDSDGVVRQDTLDYVVGLEYNLFRSSRFTMRLFQRWFPDHDPALTLDRVESGLSLSFSTSLLDGKVEPQLMVGNGLNRGDWLASPKLVWNLNGNWRWVMGADLFGGDRMGLFGQYDDKDRVYTELRYIF